MEDVELEGFGVKLEMQKQKQLRENALATERNERPTSTRRERTRELTVKSIQRFAELLDVTMMDLFARPATRKGRAGRPRTRT